jgi:ribA/ribD-fused uncharacterized protein
VLKNRSVKDPLACKKLARKHEKEGNVFDKDKWTGGYKDTVMKRALMFKFSQNKDLLERLLLTGNARLVEASKKDAYWGGLLPDSKNMLGNMLAELRDNYKKEGKIFIEGSGLEPINI